MENHTVVLLKAIAKERGIRGCYYLRKAELIHALEATRLVEQKVTSLISQFQMIPLQFYNQYLQGHQISRRKLSKMLKVLLQKNMQKTKNVFTMCIQKIRDFGEWLLNYIPPKPKVVDKVLESFKNKIKQCYEKRDSLFQPTQTKSALKNFCDSVSNKRIKWLRPRIISA